MPNRFIQKMAVLGSGVMGSRIACLFASAGFDVILLDMVPEAAKYSGNQEERNALVNGALRSAIRSNPSPLYLPEDATRISTGNFTDDMAAISRCDWIIEAVVERLDVKRQIFDEVERHRRPGSIVSSNTSGIPIAKMAEGRSDDFRKHFCGTHFFNPPRYLQLLEIIPTADTDPELVRFLLQFGSLHLGKTAVLAKDSPAFIANRVGVFGIMSVFRLTEELGLSVNDVDLLTGPLIGRPKSATFRTADLVGLDTLVRVADGVAENCPQDEAREVFTIPSWLQQMTEQGKLGEKSGSGFYKKASEDGKKNILSLNLQTLQYGEAVKNRFASVDLAKANEDLPTRLRLLLAANDPAGAFLRRMFYGLFAYASHRIPEITEELYALDDAMKAGFGWDLGVFETWDLLGPAGTLQKMEEAGYPAAPWVRAMLDSGQTNFYTSGHGQRLVYSPSAGKPLELPGGSAYLVMRDFTGSTVWSNSACRIYHLGDGVLGLEWSTKANTIGGEVLQALQKGVSLAEQDYRGLVIANEGPNFSAGANVGMIFMLAAEQDYEELDLAVRTFQQTMLRLRYARVPVVAAPHGLTLGGACELVLHTAANCPAAETYVGLVEAGVGLIPAGGGTKECALRAARETHEGEPEPNTLRKRFIALAMAKVSTSAAEGFGLGYWRAGFDRVVINPRRRIAEAKATVLRLHESGYLPPPAGATVRVLGRSAMGSLLAGIHGTRRAGYASEHDAKVAEKIAYVICGGDLSAPADVSEQYLLDLEREAFLSLTGERKTLERLQSVIKTGKPVRN